MTASPSIRQGVPRQPSGCSSHHRTRQFRSPSVGPLLAVSGAIPHWPSARSGAMLTVWSVAYSCSTETLTFLFTDIEGSTALLSRLGEAHYAQVLADHHRIIRAGLSAHDGREVSTQGDGFFAVFSSPKACVGGGDRDAARASRHTRGPRGSTSACAWVSTPARRRRRPRVWSVSSVHRAARVAAVAYGGQVLLSETAAALVRDSLPAGASLTDLGLHRLKDLGPPGADLPAPRRGSAD